MHGTTPVITVGWFLSHSYTGWSEKYHTYVFPIPGGLVSFTPAVILGRPLPVTPVVIWDGGISNAPVVIRGGLVHISCNDMGKVVTCQILSIMGRLLSSRVKLGVRNF